MSASGETLYTARVPYPDTLGTNRINAVKLGIYRDGALVAPTVSGSSFSLISPNGTAIVDEDPITVDSDGYANASIAAALLDPTAANVDLGEGWQEVWSLVFGGVAFPFDREASLARRPIYPCITDDDLLACYPDLGAIRGSTVTTFQGFIDEAWKRVHLRWLSEGGVLYFVKSAYAFREAELELALGLTFRWLGKSQASRGNYLELSTAHLAAYDRAWGRINVTEDLDHDGKVDDPESRARRGTVLNFNVPPEHRSRRMPRTRTW